MSNNRDPIGKEDPIFGRELVKGRKTPNFGGLVSRNAHQSFLPEAALGLQHTRAEAGVRGATPARGRRPSPWLPAGSARAPAGRGTGGAPRRRSRPGPTRGRSAGAGGPCPAAALASLRASPARSPKRTGQRGDYYPVIAPRTVATMRAMNPGAAGREPESREPGSAAPSAREPSTLLQRTSPGQETLGGEVIPRGRGRESMGPGAPRGSPPEERRGSHARPPGAARRPGSAARARLRWERGGRHESGFFPVRSPGLAAPCPRPGPRPGQARTGRGDSGPGRALPSRPRRPPPTSTPAQPPFRPAATRRLRPRPAPGLGRRGPSHCDTAAPGRACAADSPRPRRRRHSPAFPGCLNGSGDVSTWSLGPAPVKSPSRQGLAASLSRRGCPAWSCVRHGSRLLLPARPPALLPPPPPPPTAPRNLRPLAFPPPLPALPASPATAPVGEKLVGEGRNAPPSASGAGEPGNRRRHLPTSPRRGRGPETSRPPRPRFPVPQRHRGPARGAVLYLKARGPWPRTSAPSPAGRSGSSSRFYSLPLLEAASKDPASRHFGPNEEGSPS